MDIFSTDAMLIDAENEAFSLSANVNKLVISLYEVIPTAHSLRVVITTSLGLSPLKATIKTASGTKLKVTFAQPLKGQLDNTVKLTYKVD